MLALMAIIAASGPTASQAASPAGSITGAGQAAVTPGSTLGGVRITTIETATGVFVSNDGTALGVFHAVLSGRTLLGVQRSITIEGTPSEGGISAGSCVYSGRASIDLGDGSPVLSEVPFNVSATSSGLVLSLPTTSLAADLGEGAFTIE
jgi:hypothetical protein